MRQAAPPIKRFLQSRGPACPCAEKAVRVLRGGNLVAFWFLCLLFVFFLLGRNLCGCVKGPSLLFIGIVGKAGSLPSIPGTFWVWVWVFVGWGMVHGMHLVRVFTSQHCADCAFWGSSVSVFRKRIPCHVLGNGDGFMGAWV